MKLCFITSIDPVLIYCHYLAKKESILTTQLDSTSFNILGKHLWI